MDKIWYGDIVGKPEDLFGVEMLCALFSEEFVHTRARVRCITGLFDAYLLKFRQ